VSARRRSSGGIVIVTRPEPEASATVARLAALGHAAIAAPLLRVVKVRARLPQPGRVQAVVLGSINAVRHLPARFRGVPVLAVGDATAEAATAAGFRSVASAKGDARDLAALAARRCDPAGAPLLLATARGAGGPLAADLRRRGFRVIRRVTYATRPLARLAEPARAALAGGGVLAVAFFSGSAGAAFARVARAERLTHTLGGITALAISPAVAAKLAPLGLGAVLTAARPDQESLLALLERPRKARRGPG
jgi:uroporphyrinogen-III synthase